MNTGNGAPYSQHYPRLPLKRTHNSNLVQRQACHNSSDYFNCRSTRLLPIWDMTILFFFHGQAHGLLSLLTHEGCTRSAYLSSTRLPLYLTRDGHARSAYQVSNRNATECKEKQQQKHSARRRPTIIRPTTIRRFPSVVPPRRAQRNTDRGGRKKKNKIVIYHPP